MTDQKDKKVDENVKLDTANDVIDIKKLIPIRKSYKVLLLSSFLKELKENKLFLICFIITILSISIFSSNKVKEADGAFTSSDKVIEKDKIVTDKKTSDKLDVSKYVGYYVKNFKLDKDIKYGECVISEYDYVYEIKKDNTIAKYFYSKCSGSVLVHKDTLEYIKGENTRNIGSKSFIYVFNDNKMSEIDGLTYIKSDNYKMDNNINSVEGVNIKFYKDKFILEGLKELYLVNGRKIETNIEVSSLLTKSVFNKGNTYSYVIYNEGESQSCYVPSLIAEVGFEDKDAYSIYSLDFDEETLEFDKERLVVTRKRSDNCDTLNDDLTRLVS